MLLRLGTAKLYFNDGTVLAAVGGQVAPAAATGSW
jgi:hypothetical protein